MCLPQPKVELPAAAPSPPPLPPLMPPDTKPPELAPTTKSSSQLRKARRGRASLRIDLNKPTGGGSGLNIPV